MAKILISDDDGNVIESLIDGTYEDDEIGNLKNYGSQGALLFVIKRAVATARAKEGRDEHGHKKEE